MVKKSYDWKNGAVLDDHSKVKLNILREYFAEYLRVRCVLPQQGKFRLAVVDGFCGAGTYSNGILGSPLLLLEVLQNTERELNLNRAAEGFKKLTIECDFYFNDIDENAITLLRESVSTKLNEILQQSELLKIRVYFSSGAFEENRRSISEKIKSSKVRSVLFNLDQCGYSKVQEETLKQLMRLTPSTEIFLTFAIESFLAYLSPSRINALVTASKIPFINGLNDLDRNVSKPQWLGSVENLVFHSLIDVANYVSPFSIHNPNGWKYWLVHFANNYRARQVYNDVLHRNKSSQAHYGRAGLNMLNFNMSGDATLYLFDGVARDRSLVQLTEDIPRMVDSNRSPIVVSKFYEITYNSTPAHSDQINEAIIKNPDLEVLTPNGGFRRSVKTIKPSDILRLKQQRTFFQF